MPAAVGLLGAHAYGTAKYRRNAATTYDYGPVAAPGSAGFDRLLGGLSGTPVAPGNRVRVLRHGSRTFPAMLAAIASARDDLSSYIDWHGDVASAFADALPDRVRAGIEVNGAPFSTVGTSQGRQGHHSTMEDAGVHVSFFRPPKWHTVHKLNNRMHRRLLIVEGRVVYTGGVGIADVWAGDAEDPEDWREAHLDIEGRP